MKHHQFLALLAGLAIASTPGLAAAQNINIARSVQADLPYTLIYPDPMQASGGGEDPIIINHPNAPLQCEMSVVAVEDQDWSAEIALATLDDGEVTAAWAATLPGFTLTDTGTTAYQDATALRYEGTSTDSPMNLPLTLVHTETVSAGRGYVLDCLFATAEAEQARPIVDFIVANFATSADAECCMGLAAENDAPAR
ncbi:MAG: hypothetical protein ABS75_23090 [Pelagibacterium sp. SCN 63-23]|nr:MAG: hypothetical protein ABS75_23090 [Pelagibacterium sp. SCN 63-23]